MSSRGVRRAGIPGGGPSREGRGRRFYDYKRTYDDGCRYLFWKVKAVDSMVGVCYEWAGSDAPRRLEALDIIILIVLCKNPCNSHKYAYPADSLHIGSGDQVGCSSLDIANMD